MIVRNKSNVETSLFRHLKHIKRSGIKHEMGFLAYCLYYHRPLLLLSDENHPESDVIKTFQVLLTYLDGDEKW